MADVALAPPAATAAPAIPRPPATTAPLAALPFLAAAIGLLMGLIAFGCLVPANLAVLFELRKEHPDVELIGRIMRRFIYTAGVTGLMQIGTLIIMTRIPPGI